MAKVEYNSTKSAPTDAHAQARHDISVAKKVFVVAVSIAIPVTIFVLFKQKQSLTTDFQSLYDNYAELQEAHAVLKDNYLSLTDGYLSLSEKVLDKYLDIVPDLPALAS